MRNVLGLVLLSIVGSAAIAQQTSTSTGGHIFVVRHAEKISEKADALSPMGKSRAACLATTLKDANIKAVITSPFERTKQTGAPTAGEFKVEVRTIKADDFDAIAGAARESAKTGDVLIVGHSNTVPQIVKAVGNADVKVGDSDYDWLFVVDTAGITQLHYCPTTAPEPESRMK